MNQGKPIIQLKTLEAFIIIVMILGGISVSIIRYGAVPHIPIVLALFLLLFFGIVKKVPLKELENGMIEGAKSGLGAVMLFSLLACLSVAGW